MMRKAANRGYDFDQEVLRCGGFRISKPKRTATTGSSTIACSIADSAHLSSTDREGNQPCRELLNFSRRIGALMLQSSRYNTSFASSGDQWQSNTPIRADKSPPKRIAAQPYFGDWRRRCNKISSRMCKDCFRCSRRGFRASHSCFCESLLPLRFFLMEQSTGPS